MVHADRRYHTEKYSIEKYSKAKKYSIAKYSTVYLRYFPPELIDMYL